MAVTVAVSVSVAVRTAVTVAVAVAVTLAVIVRRIVVVTVGGAAARGTRECAGLSTLSAVESSLSSGTVGAWQASLLGPPATALSETFSTLSQSGAFLEVLPSSRTVIHV